PGTLPNAPLPTNLDPALVPAGWAGYFIQVTGFTDKVTSETGTNTASPTVTASGTVRYWNGVGYTTVNIAPGSAVNLSVASVHILGVVNGHATQIDIYGSTASLVD